MHSAKAPIGRRVYHGQQRDNLEEVVFDNVTQAAGGFVKRAATLDAEILGQRDLNAGNESSGSRLVARNEFANRKYRIFIIASLPRK